MQANREVLEQIKELKKEQEVVKQERDELKDKMNANEDEKLQMGIKSKEKDQLMI